MLEASMSSAFPVPASTLLSIPVILYIVHFQLSIVDLIRFFQTMSIFPVNTKIQNKLQD